MIAVRICFLLVAVGLTLPLSWRSRAVVVLSIGVLCLPCLVFFCVVASCVHVMAVFCVVLFDWFTTMCSLSCLGVVVVE